MSYELWVVGIVLYVDRYRGYMIEVIGFFWRVGYEEIDI